MRETLVWEDEGFWEWMGGGRLHILIAGACTVYSSALVSVESPSSSVGVTLPQ